MAATDITRQIAQAISDLLKLIFVATVRVAIDPASIAAEASGDTTTTLTGALLGDFILASWETDRFTGVNAQCMVYVSAADTVTFHISNNTVAAGAAVDIASTTVQITALRRG